MYIPSKSILQVNFSGKPYVRFFKMVQDIAKAMKADTVMMKNGDYLVVRV
jgi:hypothetical protein